MKVFITPEFINDLRESADAKFIRQVLNHTLEEDGSFRSDADDHRYKEIEDAWIRYVSKGKTAFRVIYLKKNDSIYLYRAGPHTVERKLGEPRYLEESVLFEKAKISEPFRYVAKDIGSLLKTLEPRFLNKEILSMYHVGHKEIVLIAPFVSLGILDKFHHFGRFLDRAIEENTEVTLVTRPPKENELIAYGELDERCIFVHFLQNLHAKLYIFDINPESLYEYNRDMKSTAILGSSNLTKPGFGLDDEMTSEELCYKLPADKFKEVYTYAIALIKRSEDYKTYLVRSRRR